MRRAPCFRIRYWKQPCGWLWTLSRDGIIWWHNVAPTPDAARRGAVSELRRQRKALAMLAHGIA